MLIYSLKLQSVLVLLLLLSNFCYAEEHTLAPKLNETSATETEYYTVQPNESLSAIAARYGLNYVKLARLNNIPEPYNVLAGQKLKLVEDKKSLAQKQFATEKTDATEESSTSALLNDSFSAEIQYYTVNPNESLSAIAARFGLNYIKLARLNNILEPYDVQAGQQLKLVEDKKTPIQKAPVTEKTNDELFEQELEKVIAAVPPEKAPFAKTTDNNKADDDEEVEIYEVETNESLSEIAVRFGVSFEQLAAWNNITTPDQVYARQKLKIFKNKQKHSFVKSAKNLAKTSENQDNNSQKTSIISNNNKSMLKFYYHLPTEGEIIKNFAQTGSRGIEIRGKLGQAIRAIAAGKVVAVSSGIYGHGQFIVIRHDDQLLSSYANNHRSLVKNGQTVTQGQAIAEMGRVGRKPPSLEFEIRKNGIVVNPMRFLPKKDTGS